MNRPYVRLSILFGTITAMILLMAAITLSFIERRMLALSGEALSLAAADIADKLDLVLYERAGDIQALATVNSRFLVNREFNTVSNNLAAIQQAYPIYLWLGVTDQNGRVVAATDNISVGKDRSQRSWFQQVRAQKGIYVEDPRFSEDADGASIIAFSAPIIGPQDEFLGVVTSRVGLAALENLFARTVHLIEGEHRLSGSVEWELLARDGSVLSDSGQGGTKVNLLTLAVSSAKLSLDPETRPGYVAELHDRRQVPVVTGYAHTNGYGRFVSPFLGVLVRKDRSDILRSVPTTLWQLGAAGAVVILPLWGLLFWTIRRLFRAYDDLEMRVQERTTELSQSNAILLAQQNITLDGILIVDQQGKILSFNQQFMDLWSIPREVMESRSDERAIQCVLGKLQHPEEFVARVRYLYAHPAETLRDEIALCDGRTFDRYSASMKGSDGTYYGRIWYFRDITGRKRLEEKQAQLVAILESTPDFVAMADPDGHALYLNRAGRKLIGLEEEADISGFRIADKDQPLWPADYLQEGLSIAAREGRWSGETDMLTRDGRTIPMSQVVLAHKGSDGSVAFFSTIARDITERRRAEAALRDSEEQYRALFESSRDALLLLDQQGFFDCNAAAVQLFGAASKEQLVGIPPWQLSPPTQPDGGESLVSAKDRIAKAYERGTQFFEWLHQRVDGSLFAADVLLSRYERRGKPVLQAAVRDITERKRDQEQLMEQVQLKAYAADVGETLTGSSSLAEGLHGCTDAMVRRLNAAFARIWTLDPSGTELVMRASSGLYTNLEGAHYRIPVGQFKIGLIAQEQKPHLTNNVIGDPRVPQQDWAKREGMVAFAGYPLLLEGRVLGVMAMFARKPLSENVLQAMHNVAQSVAQFVERKKSEAALAETLAELQALVRSAPIGINILDAAGHVVLWNPACEVLFGWTEQEVLGRPLPTVPESKRDELQSILDRARQEKFVRILDTKRVTKDGRIVSVELSVSLLRNVSNEVVGYLGMMIDLAERKHLETQMRQFDRLSALTQVLGGIAHQLKNPLFILMGQQQLLKDTAQRYHYEAVMADIHKTQETAKRLAAIVQQFLNLAGPVLPNRGRCSVMTAVKRTLDHLGGELARKHIQVAAACPQDLPEIDADPALLDDIFLQLMRNAIEAMEKTHRRGTLTVSAQLSAVSSQPSAPVERWIEVRIQDNGPGIPPELRNQLFEPFFTTKPPGEGTGLGLWIVRSNLMMLQGTVRVESEAGHGTTFIVRLPVVAEPSTSVDPPAPGAGRG